MKKYLRLYASFFKASFMSDIEYRLNLVVKVFTDLLWYSAQLSVFEVLFHHTPRIGGWDLPAVRVFMAMLFLIDAFWMILFQENFDRLSWKVKRGELDLLLAKPIPAQFMVSFQKQNTAYLANLVLTGVYLSWALHHLPEPIPYWRLILLPLGIPVSLAVVYSMRLFFAMASVIFTNAEAVNYVWYQIYRLGMRPDSIYPPWLRYIVLSIVPVGFIASVPARMLLEAPAWNLILGGPALAFIFVYLSIRFWNYAIRSYSSASS